MYEELQPNENQPEQPVTEPATPASQDAPRSPYTGQAPCPAAPRPHYFSVGRREYAYAAFLLLACFLAVDAFLWSAPGLAASAACVALAVISGAYLLRGGRRWSVYGIFCWLAYLAGAVSFSVTTGSRVAVPLMMLPLAAAAMLERADLRQYPGDFRAIADQCYMIFALPFGKLGQAFSVLFCRSRSGEKRHIGSVLLGVLIAVPVVLIIVPLLISSDAAFAAMLEHWLSLDRLVELVSVLLLGLFLFLLLFGRLISLPRVRRRAASVSSGNGLEPAAVVSFLAVIAAVYALYLFSQLAYFFQAFSGLLPAGFTVAEYARRGFFEMTLISALNLGLIFLSHLICRKRDSRVPLAVRLLALFLCIFSLVLSATVLSKLVLYIGSFGMTRLRILTFIFTVFLIAVFLSVAVRLFVPRLPYMKLALAAAAVLTLLCAYADIDRVIAHYNVDAYLSGRLETIDVSMLERMDSDGIVQDVLRLVDVPDTEVAQQAKELLTAHADGLFELCRTDNGAQVILYGDWRSWNATTSKARDLLLTHYDEYYQCEAE